MGGGKTITGLLQIDKRRATIYFIIQTEALWGVNEGVVNNYA